MRKIIFIALALLAPLCASAAVADSSATGFTVKYTYTLKAAPADVYQKILNVGEWWTPSHTYSQDAHNLSIDPRAGGCWCEKLPGGGGVKHMEVITLLPGSRIVFDGALGPLQSMAVTGRMTFLLSAADGGSKLSVIYAATGYTPAGMDKIAPGVDGVLSEALTRLTKYADMK